MSTLKQTIMAVTVFILFILAFSQATSSSASTSLSPSSSHLQSSNGAERSPKSVVSRIRDSIQQPLFRAKRDFSKWELQIDALKCTLKMMSLQVSHYHNNELMCCGLWKIKSLIKQTALDVCEKANNSIVIFDEMINEDLIYSSFSKSLIGDETLDCASYPEGSPVCDQLWRFIWIVFVLLVLILVSVIFGSCLACYCCIYWRNRYQQVMIKVGNKYLDKKDYQKAGSESDVSDTSSTNNNKTTSQKTKRFVQNFLFGKSPNGRPTASFNDRRALTTKTPQALPLNGTNASQTANAAGSGLSTPTDRCSSSASTSSSTVPSHKDDPV